MTASQNLKGQLEDRANAGRQVESAPVKNFWHDRASALRTANWIGRSR
jgi:hypothetical protein